MIANGCPLIECHRELLEGERVLKSSSAVDTVRLGLRSKTKALAPGEWTLVVLCVVFYDRGGLF